MSQLPFQLLELSIISAQDLAPVNRKNLQTYAVLWVNPERKLRTPIDQQGQTNPTWNEKFVFRVDDKFLSSDTSAVMIEIYAVGWFRDIPVGSVRVLISNLLPPSLWKESKSSRRFVALQIRRPRSGRPQGILNMGVTLLDNYMKSMPLYMDSASAFGYYDLMEGKNQIASNTQGMGNGDGEKNLELGNEKVKLWRSLSDRTDVNKFPKNVGKKASSVGNGSILNGSACNGSMLNGGSMVNGSEVGVPGRPGGGNGSMCSDVGPSPSIVAAAVARGLYRTPTPGPPKPGSSILEDWTAVDSSMEGLTSKIERWRKDFPPIYDCRENHNIKTSSHESSSRRRRRHTDGGTGLFTCFGKVCGCEFTIVCGAANRRKHKRLDNDSILNPSELHS